MSSEDNCPFCNENLLKERILDKSNSAYVILSNPRKVKGHLLVIPFRHVERIEDLNKTEWEDIVKLILKYHKKITGKISEGCDLRQNYMPYVNQSKVKVDHVHFHLIPRNFKDGIFEKTQDESELFEDLSEKEAEEVHRILSG